MVKLRPVCSVWGAVCSIVVVQCDKRFKKQQQQQKTAVGSGTQERSHCPEVTLYGSLDGKIGVLTN